VDLVVGGVEEVFGGRRGRVRGVDDRLCRRQGDRGRPLHEALLLSGVGGVERLQADGSDVDGLASKDLAGVNRAIPTACQFAVWARKIPARVVSFERPEGKAELLRYSFSRNRQGNGSQSARDVVKASRHRQVSGTVAGS